MNRLILLFFILVSFFVYGQKRSDIGVPLIELVQGIPDVNVESLVIDEFGDVWIGTKNKGLVYLTTDGTIVFNKDNSPLLDNNITDVVIDKEGNKWIATDRGGLAFYNGKEWKIYTVENSAIPSNTIMSLFVEEQGIWIGTYFSGLVFFDGEQWKTYSIDNSPLLSNKVTTISRDNEGILWIGTLGGGVCSIDKNEKWHVYTIYDSKLPSNFIYSIAVDPLNNKWIGTGGNGIGVFNDEYWIVFNKENSNLNDNNVHNIFITKQGTKWVSTYRKGVNFFNGVDWILYDDLNSDIPNDVITSIAYKNPNTILFGMKRNGILAFEDTLTALHPGYDNVFTQIGAKSISFGNINSNSAQIQKPITQSNQVGLRTHSPEEMVYVDKVNRTNIPYEIKPDYLFGFHLGSTVFRGDLDVREQTALIGNFGFSLEKNILFKENYVANLLANVDFGTLRGSKNGTSFRNNYKEFKFLYKTIVGNRNSSHKLINRARFYGAIGVGMLVYRSFVRDYSGTVQNQYGYTWEISGGQKKLTKATPIYNFTIPMSAGVDFPITNQVSMYFEVASSYLRTDKLDAIIANNFDKYLLFDFGWSFYF